MAYPENVTYNAANLYQAQRFPESATQTLAAATQIAPNGNVLPITASAAVLLTGTPTIVAGAAGHAITLVNVGSFPIGFQDASVIASTLRLLGGTMKILRQYQSMTLVWDSTLAAWAQIDAFQLPQSQNFSKDTPPNAANTMDDEFDDSAGMSGTSNGLNARWAWRNQGTSTLSYATQGYVQLTIPASATANLRIIEQAAPAGNYTIDARVALDGWQANFVTGGFALIDGVNGDLYTFGLRYQTVAAGRAALMVGVDRWTNVTTFNVNAVAFVDWTLNYAYLRVNYVSSTTTFNFWMSADGISWTRLGPLVDAVVHTKIGIYCNDQATSGPSLYCDWLRRSA